MEDTFDIKDGKVNKQEIVNRLVDNIRKRRSSGAYTKSDEQLINSEAMQADTRDDSIKAEIDKLERHKDITNYSYHITSHRRLIGAALARARRVVNGEVKRYMDPTVNLQREFNSQVIGALRSLVKYVDSSDERLESELKAYVDSSLNLYVNESVNRKVNEAIVAMNRDIESKIWLSNVLSGYSLRERQACERPPQINSQITYSSFCEELGKGWVEISGPGAWVPNVFQDSVAIFLGASNVVDIGCGEGNFLELMQNNGVKCYGIEIVDEYVRLGQSKGLDIRKADAASHLRSIPDASLGGIFMSQVIEHLTTDEIVELLQLCHLKLRPGANLILTTPNVFNVLVSSNLFYMDPTHKTHVHPSLLKFLLRTSGFKDIEDRFYQQMADDQKLKPIDLSKLKLDNGQLQAMKVMNQNIDRLNDLLFGFRDYAVFCRKG